ARAGGQEPDHGILGGSEVIDVNKYGDIAVHTVKDCNLKEGQAVKGKVDAKRRGIIMRHHTATHIVNGAAQKYLGSWVWQHGAFKDIDKARLDITHFEHLDDSQIEEIEKLANMAVQMNLPVIKEVLPRTEAEKRYGFRIYQGGIAPGNSVRIINIKDWDIEACGGTHADNTGIIGAIKITKAERVQDGIERLEYVAGTIGAQPEKLVEAVTNLKGQYEDLRKKQKNLSKKFASLLVDKIPKAAEKIGSLLLYVNNEEGMEEDFHVALGEESISQIPNLVYLGIASINGRTRLLVFCGSEAQKAGVKAGELVKQASKAFGGSGGGDAKFAQGGGAKAPDVEAIKRETVAHVKSKLKA
ncbi:MAG: alanine--tRNA ligase, partial [Thaumarchaeota archaeon]|nr:alanine--tRNA ligase [Nitrososphaerota archaeon]